MRQVRYKIFRRKKIQKIVEFYCDKFTPFQVEEPESIVILDPSTTPSWVIANSYFANILASLKNSTIKTFNRDRSIGHPAIYTIFKSFNVDGHIQTVINNEAILEEHEKLSKKLRNTFTTKSEVFDLHVKGVLIGGEIYETYLKKGNSTIDFKDELFWEVLDDAVYLLLFWLDFFKNHRVGGVILSHDCYNHFGILAKVAYKNNTPTYMPHPLGVQRVNKPYSLQGNKFKNYKKYFNQLSKEEKLFAIQWGKERIELRLSGKVGVDKPDSTKSAFTSFRSGKRIIKESNRIKVVITTHDFFDNPHQYGGMLFTDFHEYLDYLVKHSKNLDYDWYIKTHPDASLETQIAVKEIVLDRSNIRLIPPETSRGVGFRFNVLW